MVVRWVLEVPGAGACHSPAQTHKRNLWHQTELIVFKIEKPQGDTETRIFIRGSDFFAPSAASKDGLHPSRPSIVCFVGPQARLARARQEGDQAVREALKKTAQYGMGAAKM